jgi:hypothetical protein
MPTEPDPQLHDFPKHSNLGSSTPLETMPIEAFWSELQAQAGKKFEEVGHFVPKNEGQSHCST